jgi:sugar lactone lactonase YvrE
MSLSFASLDVTKTALSLGLSTEISTRTASVASVSGAISTSFTSLQTANNALNSGLAALSAGLAPKATISYLDGKISMMLNGAPDNLNTLAEMAAALGNNPSFTSSIIAVLSTKAETTAVNALSAAISAKGGLTEFNSLTSVVSNKANDGIITTVNNSIALLNNAVNALAATMSTLQMNGGVTNTNAIQVNGVTLSDLANRIQELYYNLGKANPSWGIINSDGTINYKLNRFANPSLVSSSLGFEYNSNGAVTKVNQLVTVKFDKDQKIVTITGGVGTTTSTVNDMVLDSNNNYLFVVPYNGDVAYYAAYKTGVTITALENQYKFAPLAPTITISAPNETSSQFATPTVTTPYANVTWNSNTQIITQQITVNTQDANATLQFGLGSYSAANITIEAATGAIAVVGQTNRFSTSSTSTAFNIKYPRNLVGTGSGAITVNILGISSKLPSASLTISNVINDNNLPPPPPPALNVGTVPSTLAFSSTFSNGFNQPMGIALDATGNIYVCDFNNHRIQQFNGTGGYIRSFGSQGFGNGYFSNPMGIAIDATGNIYVCDAFNHRIQKFTSAGAYISQFGSQGSGNGYFNYPKGIAIDATGNIYIADTNNNRIQKFTSAGAYVSTIGSAGSANGYFLFPYGIAFDATGNIYVCDSSNHRIQKFTSAGAYVSKFGSLGSGNLELNYPYGIAIDAAGYIYVCERSNHRIHKFDSNYSHVALYGSYGSNGGQFISPYGVVINAAGQLIVSDTSNNRIQIWS